MTVANHSSMVNILINVVFCNIFCKLCINFVKNSHVNNVLEKWVCKRCELFANHNLLDIHAT